MPPDRSLERPEPVIAVVGSLNIDLIAYTARVPGAGETFIGDRFVMGFGGKGAIQAVMAARLGAKVSMVGALGDDVYAGMTVDNLIGQGVDATHVARVRGSSGVAPIWVEPDGTNRIIVVPGANDAVDPVAAAAALRAMPRVDAVIGQPDGSWVLTSKGTLYVALRPTLAEFVLDMPRGAQVIYPKDLAMVMFWADIYPGARVLEAGMGSGALTLALLRAVGPEGKVISYEQRDDFARRALANIHLRMGDVTNLAVRLRPVQEGLAEEEPVDRVVLDLPEPWHLVEGVSAVLRAGGILLSYLPTIIQSHQLTETLRRHPGYTLIETFETLFRPWNIENTSVRPFHRMVAHTGFITVARRVVPEDSPFQPRISMPEVD